MQSEIHTSAQFVWTHTHFAIKIKSESPRSEWQNRSTIPPLLFSIYSKNLQCKSISCQIYFSIPFLFFGVIFGLFSTQNPPNAIRINFRSEQRKKRSVVFEFIWTDFPPLKQSYAQRQWSVFDSCSKIAAAFQWLQQQRTQSIGKFSIWNSRACWFDCELSAFEGDRFQIDTFMPIIQVMHAEDVEHSKQTFCLAIMNISASIRSAIESSRLIFRFSRFNREASTLWEMSDHSRFRLRHPISSNASQPVETSPFIYFPVWNFLYKKPNLLKILPSFAFHVRNESIFSRIQMKVKSMKTHIHRFI